jgi:endo-1,4-beta-xylanase
VKFKLLLYLLITNLSCRKEEINFCEDDMGLHELTGTPIGSAIDKAYLETNPDYRAKVIQHFDKISMENAWIWYKAHPRKDLYDWEEFDYLLNFAEQYNKDVVGHSLVYHDYLPKWVHDFKVTRSEWEDILEDHIKTIASRYRGRIKTWIVGEKRFIQLF